MMTGETMTIDAAESRVQEAEQRVAWLLDHPRITPWLKSALRTALEQDDPVAVANDAELLRDVVRFRSEAIVDSALAAVGSARG